MAKKVLKNALLICSVLLAVVLVSRIWFSSYFLPGGYDFFFSGFQRYVVNPVKGLFTQNHDDTFSQNLQTLYKPEQVVLSTSGERCVFSEGDEGFDESYHLASDVMKCLLTGEYTVSSKTTVDMDAYTATLKGKSLYVDYGKSCDFRLFSFSVCGESQSHFSGDLASVNGYAISLQDSVMDNISVYISDPKNNNIYRYVVNAPKTEINKSMEDLLQATTQTGSFSYSFELNFHKEQEGADSKILFEPLLLLELMPAETGELTGQQFTELSYEINEDLVNAILRTFSINTRSMWRYTDLTDARVFVENDATLTLYPDGVIEYQTIEGGRGLDISDSHTVYDVYAATDNAMEFVTNLCSHLPAEFFENLRIRTDLLDSGERQGVYKICFDYCVDGVPVRHKTPDGYAHTIEVVIDNGYLKSYRQYVRTYVKNGQQASVNPMLSAADLLVDSLYNETEPIKVQQIHLCYIEDETGKLTPAWNAVIDGQEHFVQ